MPDAIVIGAGIIGAAVACRLAERGMHVTVCERQRPAAGTTSTSFAWVNAHDKPPKAYHDLNAAGLAEHQRLAVEAGGAWFHQTGCLQWPEDEPSRRALRANVARLQEWGYRAEWIDAGRARVLAPDAALPEIAADLAFFPDEGWVEAPVLVHHLLTCALRAGATVRFPADVSGLIVAGGRVTGVATGDGPVHADVVLDCTGRDAGRLLAPLGMRIERQRSPGLLVVTEPMPVGLERVLLAGDLNLRPDGAGRVLVQSGALDDALAEEDEPAADQQRCEDLVRRAAAVLPALRGARVEAARLGWRALPGDGFSAVGPVAGLAGYYLVFTHSGITLGPLLGRLVAEEIAGGGAQPLLEPFRPDRLMNASASAN